MSTFLMVILGIIILILWGLIKLIKWMFKTVRKEIRREKRQRKEAIERAEEKRQWAAWQEIQRQRWSTECNYSEGISQEVFNAIAIGAGKRIKRVMVHTDGPIVYGEVTSQSGISTWYFKISFNDGGHITGAYWISTDNDDSQIPNRIAELIQSEIAHIWHR